MLDGSRAGLPLIVANHIGQVPQIRFHPFNRSVINDQGLLRQKELVIHAGPWERLAGRERLPAAKCFQSLSSMRDGHARLIKAHGFTKAVLYLIVVQWPHDDVFYALLLESTLGQLFVL